MQMSPQILFSEKKKIKKNKKNIISLSSVDLSIEC